MAEFKKKRSLWLVVEGVGDVVNSRYLRALGELRDSHANGRKIRVTFVDRSQYWKDDPELAKKMTAIINNVKKMGFEYLDKSVPADENMWRGLAPDFVIIATPDRTHVEVTKTWLQHPREPKAIFIEKPLDVSREAAFDLLGEVDPFDNRVLAFDHYRARMLSDLEQKRHVIRFLGGGISKFIFYLLEDHSGSDAAFRAKMQKGTSQRQGPIENEQRVKTLNEGVILDLMPHVVSILAHFGPPALLRVTAVRAGQYVGVDGSDAKRTEIANETFAEVHFICPDHRKNVIEGTVYLGKGIRGSKDLNLKYQNNYDRDTKLLEVEGLNDNRILFDLRSAGAGASRAQFVHREDGVVEEVLLNVDPYLAFFKKIADRTYLRDELALNVEVGKNVLDVIYNMRLPVVMHERPLSTYPCGIENKRESPYLEDLIKGGMHPLDLIFASPSVRKTLTASNSE